MLPNAVRLEILGGGQLCGFNEPTPTRNTKTHLRSLSVSALPLGDGKVATHQCLSVIPQRFRCVLRVPLPCGISKFAKNFGIRIKYFRLLRGMTQETLSDKIAMSTRYVSDIENGKVNVTLKTIHKIAESLAIEEWELLKFHDCKR